MCAFHYTRRQFHLSLSRLTSITLTDPYRYFCGSFPISFRFFFINFLWLLLYFTTIISIKIYSIMLHLRFSSSFFRYAWREHFCQACSLLCFKNEFRCRVQKIVSEKDLNGANKRNGVTFSVSQIEFGLIRIIVLHFQRGWLGWLAFHCFAWHLKIRLIL